MRLKLPQGLNVGVKGVRGFSAETIDGIVQANVAHQPVHTARQRLSVPQIRQLVLTPKVRSQDTVARPGEETEVKVALDASLPVDVQFEQFAASVHVVKEATAGSQQSQSATVKTTENGTSETYEVDIDVPSVPTSLTVRLADGEPIWTFNNALTPGQQYALPEMAEAVNAFLDAQIQAGALSPAGPIELRFLIESNQSVTLALEVWDYAYSRIKTQTWPNEMDGTTRVERNLTLDFGQTASVPLEPLSGTDLKLREIRVDIGGEFGAERMLGRPPDHDGREFATVNSDFALAQGISLTTPVHCVGVAGLLIPTAETELYVALQADQGGIPAAAEPLAQTTLPLSPPEPDSPPGWRYIPFDAPADLQAETPYWIVIRGIQGRIIMAVQADPDGYLTETRVNRGGQLWRPFDPQLASKNSLLRLIYLPDLDSQTAAVHIRLQHAAEGLLLDPQAAPQTLAPPLPPAAQTPARLIITSNAQGTLSLANLIQQYGNE